MPEQILVHKPKGFAIPEDIFTKLKKEYISQNIFYLSTNYKNNDMWHFTDKSMPLKDSECFLPENESVICFIKTAYPINGANPVVRTAKDDHWTVTLGVGEFPFLTCVNDRGSESLSENFLQYLDSSSLQSFLHNICKKYKIHYASIERGGPLKKYGNWTQIGDLYFSEVDFFYKIAYEAKTAAKNILAYLTNPKNFKEEIKRYETMNDLQLRKECSKYPDLEEILSKIV